MRIGDADLASDLLVAMAALEITVHGWDVAQAIGSPSAALPPDLARALLGVAHAVVGPADRGRRFAAPLPPTGHANGVGGDDPDRLLAWLGRTCRLVRTVNSPDIPAFHAWPPRALPSLAPCRSSLPSSTSRTTSAGHASWSAKARSRTP